MDEWKSCRTFAPRRFWAKVRHVGSPRSLLSEPSAYLPDSSYGEILAELEKDPVLHRIARIVDEADVVQEVTLEATAPGLNLICRGIRLISPDDWVALERGRLIYDALYAQLAVE